MFRLASSPTRIVVHLAAAEDDDERASGPPRTPHAVSTSRAFSFTPDTNSRLLQNNAVTNYATTTDIPEQKSTKKCSFTGEVFLNVTPASFRLHNSLNGGAPDRSIQSPCRNDLATPDSFIPSFENSLLNCPFRRSFSSSSSILTPHPLPLRRADNGKARIVLTKRNLDVDDDGRAAAGRGGIRSELKRDAAAPAVACISFLPLLF